MKYNIKLLRMTEFYIDIEAEDDEEANEKALLLAEDGKISDFEESDEDWEVLDCEELD